MLQSTLNAQFDLQVTEIFPGQTGSDLTEDWFEITNIGDQAWVSGVDGDLYYDDESADPTVADQIFGITDIQPGESVVVVVENSMAIMEFIIVWSPDYNLNGIEIGNADGAGLGGDADAVNLWVGVPSAMNLPVVTQTYTGADNFDGQTFDAQLNAYSTVGNANQAVATSATGGSNGNVPNVGSPGNQGPVVANPMAPELVADSMVNAPYLRTPANGPAALAGDLNDPSDVPSQFGIDFTISDADNSAAELTLTITSDNQAVVPDANLTNNGTVLEPSVIITPVAVGFANIT